MRISDWSSDVCSSDLLGKVMKLDRLLQSPFTMAKELHSKIELEIAHTQAGRPARIIAKMNALVEPEMIRALYRASQAGVRVDLIVRGMCSLRPGARGLDRKSTRLNSSH